MTSDQMIERFAVDTVSAIGLLYANNLYGHVLIVVFSSIDTMGLLDAPPHQVSATGASFKAWVRSYLTPDPRVEFTDVDLWGARCAVLHTFTTESDLSKAGSAKELQYYGGDKATRDAQKFDTLMRTIHGGSHLPVHLDDLIEAFLAAFKSFIRMLDANCKADPAYEARLSKVLQVMPMKNAL